jgi:threonine dehydrogenase-like Zn-dependent dehydrogenase
MQIRAVVVDPAAPGKLAIKPVELRDPDRDEVAVRVTAISLNRGETRRAVQQAEPGWRPGWDFAGIIDTAAADGSGPGPGTRVVGILPSGAWAERVNCRTHAVAAPHQCAVRSNYNDPFEYVRDDALNRNWLIVTQADGDRIDTQRRSELGERRADDR